MVRFGVSIYSISRKIMNKEITPECGVRWLSEQGAEVIELVPFGMDLTREPELAGRLKSEADACGVELANYSLNADFLIDSKEEHGAEIARIKSHIDAAAQLGIKTMRIDCSSYRRDINANHIENFLGAMPKITETYESLCGYAGNFGMTILVENHGHLANGSDRVRHILKSVPSRNIGHQLDVGNFICVDEKPETAVRKMAQFATTVHMKDFYIRKKDPGDATQFDCSGSWFKSLGGAYLRGSILAQGDLDVYDILHTVKASGFDGNIFIEFEGLEDCFYGTKVSLDNLKRIYGEC